MRRFINIVNETLLLEAQRYEDMFNPVMKLAALIDQAHAVRYTGHREGPDYNGLDDDLKSIVDDRASGSAKQREWSVKIADEIRWAKSELKRQDRIVWYLRLVRMEMVSTFGEKQADLEASGNDDLDMKRLDYREFAKHLWDKWLNEYHSGQTHNERSWTQTPNYSHVRDLKRDLPHFLSLPVHDIQTYVFDRQVISQVYEDLNAMEKEWQAETRNTVAPSEDDDVILSKFMTGGHEWAWLNLHRPYCSTEAEAMGHCGNRPRQSSGDTILSLRKKIKRGDSFLWKPYATFILTDEGHLTEMKGRFNDKPSAHGDADVVHEMIIALLKLPMVKKIVGGGHAAQNNFSVNDLEPEQRDALFDERPELANAWYYLEKKGYDKTFADILAQEIKNTFGDNRMIWDVTEERVIIDRWDKLDEMLLDYWFDKDEPISSLIDLAKGDWDELSIEDADQLTDSIDQHPNMFPTTVEYLDQNEVNLDSHHDALETLCDAMKERVAPNIDEYVYNWLRFLPYEVQDLRFDKNEDGSIEVWVPTRQLARALDQMGNTEDGEIDDMYLGQVASEGWLHYDSHEAAQLMKENAKDYFNNTPEEVLTKMQKVIDRLVTRLLKKLK